MSTTKALEEEMEQKEKDLELMGWVRMACDYWEDPLTGAHMPTSKAWDMGQQRRKKTAD